MLYFNKYYANSFKFKIITKFYIGCFIFINVAEQALKNNASGTLCKSYNLFKVCAFWSNLVEFEA